MGKRQNCTDRGQITRTGVLPFIIYTYTTGTAPHTRASLE